MPPAAPTALPAHLRRVSRARCARRLATSGWQAEAPPAEMGGRGEVGGAASGRTRGGRTR